MHSELRNSHVIFQVLEHLGSKMSPTISRYLLDSLSACTPQRRSNHTNLLQFLDENLIFLKEHLVPSNFDRVLAVIWSASTASLADIIERAIANKYPVPYFANLYEAFRILLNFFYGDNIPTDDPSLVQISRLLRIYACDSMTLMSHYFSCRYSEQGLLLSLIHI